MTLLLGIDTGGTYTDAVLYDRAARRVVASAKALTTRHDLAVGVGEAMARALAAPGRADETVALVSLSTTLATNAIVEGQGGRVCLLLIGFEPAMLERAGLRRALEGDPVVSLAGGHNSAGEAQLPLDLEAARAAILEHAPAVEAFAVAGQFAVRNPTHERAVAALVRALTDRPVTCGHELTAGLDAPRRALTTLLNARLIPLLDGLIRAVQARMAETGLDAPLMVVRGDGTLVAAAAALDRPIETLLSGPAASIAGARALTGLDDALVSDIGGTTTDVAVLAGGRPALAPEGPLVGGWRTMVEAVAVQTSGLGGDSWVRLGPGGALRLGPRRALPLSLLAQEHPSVLDLLRRQAERPLRGEDEHAGCFAVAVRPGAAPPAGLRQVEAELLAAAQGAPLPLQGRIGNYLEARALDRLIDRGLLGLSAFTPSDAGHVLGLQQGWSREAARLGAAHLARLRARARDAEPETPEALSKVVREALTRGSAECLVDAAFVPERPAGAINGRSLGAAVLDRALRPERGSASGPVPLIDIALRLTRPLVALGAPAAAVYPAVAERLNAELVLPEDAAVANAVGAAAGDVSQAVSAVITAPSEGVFRAHLVAGPRDFRDLEAAAEVAREECARLAGERAGLFGAAALAVTSERRDRTVQVGGTTLFVESVVTARASGLPDAEGAVGAPQSAPLQDPVAE